MTACCATCRFWKQWKDLESGGKCQARPPMVIAAAYLVETRWPETRHDDWCGEYQA